MRHTFTAMTYNIGGKWELERRIPGLANLLALRAPDLLGVQELQPETRAMIDETLHHHERVHDDAPGWSNRGNLWWDSRVFDYVTHGFVDVGILAEHSGLFWVKLTSRVDPGAPAITFATVHMTAQNHPDEAVTERSPRTEQARRSAAALTELAGNGPALLCVDINDYARATWAMYDAGFREPFGFLDRPSPPTHPTYPRVIQPGRWTQTHSVQKAIDWVYFRGPVRPRAAEVVEYYHEGFAPSDHRPVVATFLLDG